ncbi:MAG: hypothetical protein ACJ71Z_09685 [Aeromicrobium sp.]
MMTRRAPDLVDFYRHGSESVAMAGTNVVRLTELSTHVVETCSEWTPIADLAVRLTDHFGMPPGTDSALAMTADAVRELTDLGVLETRDADIPLQVSEARDVLAAMVSRVAADGGIDLLLIKGTSISHHGLRTPRAWGDVDVLVRPGTEPMLRRILAEVGWTVPNEPSPRPLPIPLHALTLAHPRWSTEIDVHHYFPGCYGDPADVFELFWSGRTVIDSAHQPVATTGLHASALIAGLNLMRGPEQPWTRSETEEWLAAVKAWDPGDRQALAELAAAAGATDTIADLLGQAGVTAVERGTTSAADLADWGDRVAASRGDGYEWGLAISRAPWLRKPWIAIQAVMFDADAYRHGLPQPHGLQRLRRSARRWPKAWRWLASQLRKGSRS